LRRLGRPEITADDSQAHALKIVRLTIARQLPMRTQRQDRPDWARQARTTVS
jgi:hypothetical protein